MQNNEKSKTGHILSQNMPEIILWKQQNLDLQKSLDFHKSIEDIYVLYIKK
jgi:hypothetical protein